MARGLLTYFVQKLPGRPGIWVRRRVYGRYLGHRNFTILEDVILEGLAENIRAGVDLQINTGVKLFSGEGTLRIGSHVFINNGCFFSANRSKIVIGDNCLFGNRVSVLCSNHQFKDPLTPIRLQPRVMKPVIIGNDVWIGSHAVLLPGTIIGDGAVVAAGAVVSNEVPELHVVGGVPARTIKVRGES